MSLITPQVRKMITACDQLGWVCTVDSHGTANVSPRYILDIGPDYIAWGNSFTNKTYYNVSANPEVSVAFADYGMRTGYELVGEVTMIDSGPLYEQICQLAVARGFPRAKKVSRMTVRAVRPLAPQA